jgi:hypothetical protein
MLVCESMETCIFVCTCAKSSIQMSILVPVSGRGRGFGSDAWLGLTMRGIVTTPLLVTRVATHIPSAH